MTFHYVQNEDLYGCLTADDPDIELAELLDVRGQLFLWAHVVAQAVKQANEQQARVARLFTERLAATQRYWPAEVDQVRAQRDAWSELIVNLAALKEQRFRLEVNAGARPAVEFLLTHPWRVVARGVGLTFSQAIPAPKELNHALQIARRLVEAAVERLTPLQGTLPTPVAPGE